VVALGTPTELKREIGGDVIVLESKNPQSLAMRIRSRFGVEAREVDGQVRIEKDQGHRFVTNLVEAFPGEIDAISISKPTLEDVFIRRTGHRFWSERESSGSTEARKDRGKSKQ
jgi:ABC-2 type transport system ATP-binding protein